MVPGSHRERHLGPHVLLDLVSPVPQHGLRHHHQRGRAEEQAGPGGVTTRRGQGRERALSTTSNTLHAGQLQTERLSEKDGSAAIPRPCWPPGCWSVAVLAARRTGPVGGVGPGCRGC